MVDPKNKNQDTQDYDTEETDDSRPTDEELSTEEGPFNDEEPDPVVDILDDYLSQYDDDPNVYDGTYSEE